QTLEAADVEEEIERPQVRRRQPRHVADDVAEPGCAPALRLCRLDRGRHVVDAHGLPSPPRELGGVKTAAAAEVDRTAHRAGALGLFALQPRGDACGRRRPIALPGCEPEPVQAGVVRHGLTSWRHQAGEAYAVPGYAPEHAFSSAMPGASRGMSHGRHGPGQVPEAM